MGTGSSTIRGLKHCPLRFSGVLKVIVVRPEERQTSRPPAQLKAASGTACIGWPLLLTFHMVAYPGMAADGFDGATIANRQSPNPSQIMYASQ